MTGTTAISHHQHGPWPEDQLVPSSWQTSGPITLAGDTPAIIRWDQAYNRSGDDKLPRAVVNVLRTYMDNDDLDGWVKRETLMRDTGLSERQVDRHIAANVKAGWLAITSRGHSGGKSNDYRLTYPKADISVTETQTDLSMQTDIVRVV